MQHGKQQRGADAPAGRRAADRAFALVTALASILLFLIPSPSRSPYAPGSSERAVGRIIEVDNSVVKSIGPVKEGDQQLEVRILTGRFKGREFPSVNHLIGKLELDKSFSPGDRVLLVLDLDAARQDVAYANVIDHFRLDILAGLAALFFGLLLAFAGWTGLKSALSFAFAAIVILKVLLPAYLLGLPPIPITLAAVAALTGAILFLVGGFNRRSLAAFSGSMAGVCATAILAVLVTKALRLNGATQPYVESLLYAGYGNIRMQDLFISGIFLASSGAILDIGMDIAAAMDEVLSHRPDIGRAELLRSGLSVGRLVIGTQTTTLLLAYSSGYSGLLMTFIAQGLPAVNALNLVFVAAELVHTLVGSLGLVLVAPLTALAGSLLLPRPGKR
jgi:uncharacterized membrane protein